MPQSSTHFSWIPKRLSGLLRQLKSTRMARTRTCKKQHIHKDTFLNTSPKPLPSILSRPFSCASDKKHGPNEEKREEQRLKRIRGNSSNRDAEGRHVMLPFLFLFSNSWIKPKMKPNQNQCTLLNGMKPNTRSRPQEVHEEEVFRVAKLVTSTRRSFLHLLPPSFRLVDAFTLLPGWENIY